MMGRAACQTPWLFSDIDRRYFKKKNLGFSRKEILLRYGEYCDGLIATSGIHYSFPKLTKPVINLFAY